ncbi:MAG TPA: prolipoprotein diacylglyceryl transferase [Verrucomicrobiota bacterium]|nr:prolipoprotein diacylglyceryl transferase [Verrucomicrobiales bacterium]HRI11727.1 prolipoprotein diacylglyceryl transferase [Verrucomicrobiota bacterium]
MKPILFHLGHFPIHTFGVLVALGFLAGLMVSAFNMRRLGLNGEAIYDLAPWLVVAGLVGARVWYVGSYWQRDFVGRPWTEAFAVWQGGLVYYGGLILGTLVGIWRIHAMKLPLWTVADCLAPGVALGHAFGRLGCLMNGCCFGRPTTLPWGIHFPPTHSTHPAAVHPTQIYEALLNVAFFAALMWGVRHRRFPGQVFSVYLMGYAVLRSFTEWFRGDYDVRSSPLAGVLTPGQLTSLLILIAGIALFLVLRPRSTDSPVIRR